MDRSTKNKIKATLFIIIFLLLAAVIIYFMVGNKDREYYTPVNPIQTMTVLETVNPVTPSPAATAAPTPIIISTPEITATPEPTPSPEPTVEITPEPVIIGQEVGRGSFRSNTRSLIDITADYSAWVASDSSIEVGVTVSLDHYTLHAISGDTLNISLGNDFRNLHVEAIDTDDNAQQTTVLGAYTFSVPYVKGQAQSLPLAVEWHFGGSYHGVDLSVLECGGMVDITP